MEERKKELKELRRREQEMKGVFKGKEDRRGN